MFVFSLSSSDWFVLVSQSFFRPKQLPEVGEEDGEPGRSVLKAAWKTEGMAPLLSYLTFPQFLP